MFTACPILKKWKPKQDPNSFRNHRKDSFKFELCHCVKPTKQITKGMPITAGLILSELMAEVRNSKNPLYIDFMDARKAFDVVSHNCLFRDMYKSGIEGDNWLFLKKMVRWS